MASLIGDGIHLDYSVLDGSVTFLRIGDDVLVEDGTEAEGWKEELWAWAVESNMHVEDGMGLRAWVMRLARELGKEVRRLQ